MNEERRTSLGSILCPHCKQSITLTKVVTIIEPATKALKDEKIVAEKSLQKTLAEVT
jgi:hypothetical protein